MLKRLKKQPTIHLTFRSENQKTGPIPVSTSSADTCPKTCKQREGCYGKSGPLCIHWREVTDGNRGTNPTIFYSSISSLPHGQLWRHNQAGDLHLESLQALVKANKGKKGFSYTHHKTKKALQAVKGAIADGFTINISADSWEEADKRFGEGFPVTVVVPEDTRKSFLSPRGNLVIICPNVTFGRQCIDCASKFCQNAMRGFIIGFPVHGSGKKKAITLEVPAC